MRDTVGGAANNVVVLAKHHMGPVFWDPSTRHYGYGVTVLDRAADLDPRHVGHVDGVGHRRGECALRERQIQDDDARTLNTIVGHRVAAWTSRRRSPRLSRFAHDGLLLAAAGRKPACKRS